MKAIGVSDKLPHTILGKIAKASHLSIHNKVNDGIPINTLVWVNSQGELAVTYNCGTRTLPLMALNDSLHSTG